MTRKISKKHAQIRQIKIKKHQNCHKTSSSMNENVLNWFWSKHTALVLSTEKNSKLSCSKCATVITILNYRNFTLKIKEKVLVCGHKT